MCIEFYLLDLIQHSVMILWPLMSEQALPKTTDQCDFITSHRIKPLSGMKNRWLTKSTSCHRHWDYIWVTGVLFLSLCHFFPITWSTCLWPYLISFNMGFVIRGVTLRSQTRRVRCCNNNEYKDGHWIKSWDSTTNTLWWRVRQQLMCRFWTRTWCEDLLGAGVGGEHLTHELLLLLPVVVLQVVHQHHVSGLLHRHHLAEHLQLQHRRHDNTITSRYQQFRSFNPTSKQFVWGMSCFFKEHSVYDKKQSRVEKVSDYFWLIDLINWVSRRNVLRFNTWVKYFLYIHWIDWSSSINFHNDKLKSDYLNCFNCAVLKMCHMEENFKNTNVLIQSEDKNLIKINSESLQDDNKVKRVNHPQHTAAALWAVWKWRSRESCWIGPAGCLRTCPGESLPLGYTTPWLTKTQRSSTA